MVPLPRVLPLGVLGLEPVAKTLRRELARGIAR